MQNVAKYLDSQKINVIVAALYSHPKLLKRNKKIFKEYKEVYLKANIGFLLKREVKNIYAQAINKKMKNVVGLDIKWHEPKKPDFIFEQTNESSLKDTSKKIII